MFIKQRLHILRKVATILPGILVRLFEHNHWANLQLIQTCSALSAEQLDAEPQSATKGSIRLTLYKNHLVFQKIERPHLFVVDHLSGPKYHGTVTFDDVGSTTRVTMYWTFENVAVFDKIRDTVIAGNVGNFDRLSAVVAG